jgi:hypothetical protein
VVEGITLAGGDALFIPSSLTTVADARSLAAETSQRLKFVGILLGVAAVICLSIE